jgi:integrase
MLGSLPKISKKVFGEYPLRGFYRTFHRQRMKVAEKLKNPRLLQISFHALRHWKATVEYHKTWDILHIMKILGHKNIENPLIYIDLEKSHLRLTQKRGVHS